MKKLLCVLVVLTVLTTGCKKTDTDDFEVIGTSDPKAEVTVSVASLGEFKYHIIINENNEEVLVDDNGNTIEQSNDGKFYDPDTGKEIKDYEESAISVEPVLIDGSNQVDLAKEIMGVNEQNNDSRIEDGDDTEANDYNPDTGNKVATAGTVINQTVFTNDGLSVNSKITITNSSVTNNSVSLSLTIDYDTGSEEVSNEVLTYSVGVYCTSGMFYASDSKIDSIESSGSLTGSFTVSIPEGETVDYAVLRISSSEIKLS